MPIELTLLTLSALLLVVQIFLAAAPRTFAYGFKWAASSRDEQKAPPNVFAERATRASANMQETFPIFAAAVLAVVVMEKTGGLAAVGAWLYFVCRVMYVPIYVSGVALVRSFVWMGALLGICLILLQLFVG